MITVLKSGFQKKNIMFIGIGGVLLCFFFLYSFIAFQETSAQPIRFNSPDETANYYFSKMFAEYTEIGYRESLLKDTKGLIHPRSMTMSSDTERVVPVGFLGMVLLYGFLGKIFGSGAIPFFTPAIAVISSVFFYLFLSYFFSKRVALLSSVLLLIHPAYWYYSSRGMFPNVLFVDLLIIGFFLLWKAFYSRMIFLFFLSGLCIGGALTVRLSELPWMFLLLFFTWICTVRKFRVGGTILFTVGIVCALAVLFYYNQQIYGNALSFGYAQIDTRPTVEYMQKALSTVQQGNVVSVHWWQEIGVSLRSASEPFLKYLFPFGFVPHVFKSNFLTYFISMFWWFTIPAVIGIGGLFFDGIRRIRAHSFPREWGYGFAFFLVSLWLIPFYGSWIVMDNVTGEATLGNAYVRYWLVLYCFAMPLAAYALCHLYTYARSFVSRNIVIPIFCAVFVLYSFQGVLWQKTEGLMQVSKHIAEYRDMFLRISPFIEKEAVVFSSRSDKIFFPEIRAAQSFDGFGEVEIIPALLENTPAYYYGIGDQSFAAYISQKYFSPYGLRLEYVSSVSGVESLYRVVK